MRLKVIDRIVLLILIVSSVSGDCERGSIHEMIHDKQYAMVRLGWWLAGCCHSMPGRRLPGIIACPSVSYAARHRLSWAGTGWTQLATFVLIVRHPSVL